MFRKQPTPLHQLLGRSSIDFALDARHRKLNPLKFWKLLRAYESWSQDHYNPSVWRAKKVYSDIAIHRGSLSFEKFHGWSSRPSGGMDLEHAGREQNNLAARIEFALVETRRVSGDEGYNIEVWRGNSYRQYHGVGPTTRIRLPYSETSLLFLTLLEQFDRDAVWLASQRPITLWEAIFKEDKSWWKSAIDSY
jgi:hypothetical protein